MRACVLLVVILAAGCRQTAAGDTAAARPAPSRLLAVLELHSKLSGSERLAVDAGYLANAVRAEVLKSAPGVRVMTRENTLVLLEASGRRLEECEGECEVETGRRLGAELVVSGDLLRFGTSYKLDLRLHDTGSGELLAGAAASGETASELDRNVAAAVAKLVGPLRPAEARAAEDRVRLPASATCQGRNFGSGGVISQTEASFQWVRHGDDVVRFHYQSVTTRGAAVTSIVDGEWHFEGSGGGFAATASTGTGDRFTGSSAGWQGQTLIESGTLQTAKQEMIPYRSTWLMRGARRLAFRFELLLNARWVTIAEDDCSW